MIPLNHTGTAAQTSLSASASNSATTIAVLPPPVGAWPQANFVITVDRNSPNEEKMLVTAVSTDRASLTVSRAFDGTAAVAHNQDAVVEHTLSAAELQWLSDHINGTSGHGLTSSVVGVDDFQTLKNKVINDVDNDISISTSSIFNYSQIVASRDANFVKRNSALGVTERTPNEAGVATGTVVLWSGAGALPIGWLRCDGDFYSKVMYPELYSILGDQYTDPAQVDTFAVPDLRSYEPPFLRYLIFDGIGGP